MMTKKKLIVVGGGFAGIQLVRKLDDDLFDILLITFVMLICNFFKISLIVLYLLVMSNQDLLCLFILS